MSTTFITNLETVFDLLDDRLDAALEECGHDAEYYAAKACPVDTGRLRNSITHATSTNHGKDTYSDSKGNSFSGGGARGAAEKYTVAVGTNVEYAQFIENGVHGKPAREFLKPAFANHVDHYKRVIERHLDK